MKRFLLSSVIIAMAFTVLSCSTVQHKVNLHKNYSLQTGTKIELDKVINKTGKAFDIDIEKMLADAFKKELKSKNLLWTQKDKIKLTLTANIIEYKQGGALGRWLFPGLGTTVLAIKCDLLDNNQIVGSVEAKRTFGSHGEYSLAESISAWKDIFDNVAKDVVTDLWGQIH